MKLLTHNLDNLIRILQVVYINFEPWKCWEFLAVKAMGFQSKYRV